MTPRAVGRRYAAALFDVAKQAGSLERVERDLAAFNALVEGHEGLRDVLATPLVPPQKKQALVDALAKAAGGLTPEVHRLLNLLAERDRLANLSGIASAFEARLMAMRRVVQADVTSAVPMGEARKSALADALGHATGGQIRLSERVDPSIIGGLIARVGGIVFDGSVARQLERMRERLRQSV